VRVGALAVYPLKGGRAIALDALELDEMGPSGDRRFCLIRPGGRIFTQRDDARLARVHASCTAGGLRLAFEGDAIEIRADAFVEPMCARVWSREAKVLVAGGDVDARLAEWLGTPLQLAKLARPVQREGAALAFGDAAALLVTNAASLDALNGELSSPVPMSRFRPNVVIDGAYAYAEDGWGRLRLGEAVIAPVHPCGRCKVTTIDQDLGASLGGEPLRTLSRLRLRDGEAVFGVRYAVQRPGAVRVGDVVEPLA
jgi:uncharacterized protein